MCGRFTLENDKDLLASAFGLVTPQDIQPRYNIAPNHQVSVIRTYHDGTRHLDHLRWGLIPSWSKDPSIGSRMINVGFETACKKPSYGSALKSRRCIIPANGFYLWQKTGGYKKPLYVKLRGNGLMAFAGLWDCWKSKEGIVIESCAILTTGANDLLKPLHERMPVILDANSYDLWLDLNIIDTKQLKQHIRTYPSEMMTIYPVNGLVDSLRNDSPECISPGNCDFGSEW